MKKFNEWMEDRAGLVNEDTPHSASMHYGRFLGQIMGWDSHGDPKTLSGRFANWRAGGRHRKAQEMGADLYDTIANPNAITNIIARAQRDGVYRTSTFNACYEAVKKISGQYRAGAAVPGLLDLNTPQFQSMLLHEILGKCHKNMALEYADAESFYHNVVGTNPAVKKALSAAYDKDPKDLKDWQALAATQKPHPEYDATNYSTRYWLLESQGIISPLNLVKMLINKSPDKALSLPQNARELQNYSVEFAEAYFPNVINKRKAANAAAASSGGGGGKPDLSKLSPQERYGDDLDAMINVINHFAKNHGVDMTKGDGSVNSGKKRDLMNALAQIMGPAGAAAAEANADSKTLLKVLADHNNFFGMQQLLELEKLD